MTNYFNNMENFLTHPLFLLLITALVSGILVPYFTRKYQSYQKELDLKINLMIKISESVFDIINVLETHELKPHKDSTKLLSDRLAEWVKNAHMIRTYIRAYFPGNSIINEWDRYRNIIEKITYFSIEENTDERLNKLKALKIDICEYEQQFISRKNIDKKLLEYIIQRKPSNKFQGCNINLKILSEKPDDDIDGYRENWINLEKCILEITDNLSYKISKLYIKSLDIIKFR